MLKSPYLLLLLLTLPLALPAQSPEVFFGEANEAYSRGEYEKAIGLYQRALEEAASAALHYNLGNAFYRTGQSGRAILHFEKALALDPTNPEALANLSFVREAAELPIPEYGPLTRFARLLPLNTWIWLLAGSFWSALAFTLIPRLYGGGDFFTRTLLTAAILLILAASSALIDYHKRSRASIILNNDTPLLVAPSSQSPEAGYLRAGELATIEKQHEDYYYLNLGNGKTGWVRHTEIGKIWD